jgi:hypothetical protein
MQIEGDLDGLKFFKIKIDDAEPIFRRPTVKILMRPRLLYISKTTVIKNSKIIFK